MSNLPLEAPNRPQTLLMGAAAGLAFGIATAYMYLRASEESARLGAVGTRVKTGEVVGLGLAALAIMRQAAEMGREDPPPKKR